MGLLNCKIHGETGVMPYVSNSIVEQLSSNNIYKAIQIVRINVVFHDNEEFLFDRKYFFTEDEIKKFSLKNSYLIKSEEESTSFSNLMENKLHPICIQCFIEFMIKIGYSEMINKL